MNILITNDDGILSDGIKALVNAFRDEHNVIVVAPDSERSASGHAITIRTPIKYKSFDVFSDIPAYGVSGSPADCVKFGLSFLSKNKIDIVISGINHGKNLGTDVFYSGTVSAAMEAVIGGYKAIAVSYSGRDNYNFDYAANFVAKNLDKFIEHGHMLFNINFPYCDISKIEGVKYTSLGSLRYTDTYKLAGATESEGYILTNPPNDYKQEKEDCDINWNEKNYVTITPLMQDITDFDALNVSLKDITL